MKALILINGHRVMLTWAKLPGRIANDQVLHPLAANDVRVEEWR